jgi:tetraacyldisaccharide 4'-kinase
MLENSFFEIWYKKKLPLLPYFLLPLSICYYFFWKILDLYYRFVYKPKQLNCPVISVGNISVGGTGKTPFIIYLIEFLLKRGIKDVVLLTRGYKGKKIGYITDTEGEPDEARLIKRRFPHVTVLANPNRHRVFFEYFRDKKLPQLVILDDGFQHRKIKRDLDIIMVDGMLKFGNGFLIPAGPLREPKSSIKKG